MKREEAKKRKTRMIVGSVLILIAFTLSAVLGACGNHKIGFGNFTFRKVHIFTHDGRDRCLTIEKWYENNVGIEVRTKECGTLWLSEGTYMLCEDECPICGREREE